MAAAARSAPPSTHLRQAHDVRVSLPWLFAAWAIVVAAVAWRRIDRVGRRLIVLLTGLAGLYLYLIVSRTPWRSFPHFLYNIQFTWRLHSYVLLATALLVMVVLVWQARANDATRRATSAALAVIAVFTVGAATWQAWAVPSTYHENNHDLPAPSNFADIVVADRYVQPAELVRGRPIPRRERTGLRLRIRPPDDRSRIRRTRLDVQRPPSRSRRAASVPHQHRRRPAARVHHGYHADRHHRVGLRRGGTPPARRKPGPSR